jgi:hypothetical protein
MVADNANDEGRPPFFRTWRGAYALVLGVLIVEVVALAIMSWSFP